VNPVTKTKPNPNANANLNPYLLILLMLLTLLKPTNPNCNSKLMKLTFLMNKPTTPS